MEDRLKGLRKSMENTTFKHLSFSDQHRKRVREKINASHEKEEDISLAILQLLSNEKTGYELSQLLRGERDSKNSKEMKVFYILYYIV